MATFFLKNLRGDVRKTATDTRRASPTLFHVFPAHALSRSQSGMRSTENFWNAKVGDFQMTVSGHEQVLELDISMCDTMAMKICHTSNQLLEETEVVFQR